MVFHSQTEMKSSKNIELFVEFVFIENEMRVTALLFYVLIHRTDNFFLFIVS